MERSSIIRQKDSANTGNPDTLDKSPIAPKLRLCVQIYSSFMQEFMFINFLS